MATAADIHKAVRWRDYAAVLFALLAILCAFALWTYDYRDIHWEVNPCNRPCHNWVGIVGAYGAYFLFQGLGMPVYALPVLLLVMAVTIYLRVFFTSWKGVAMRVGVLVLVLMTTACFCALVHPGTVKSINMSAGGHVGQLLIARVNRNGVLTDVGLKRYCGSMGAGAILVGLTLLELLFLFDTTLKSGWRMLAALGRWLALGIAGAARGLKWCGIMLGRFLLWLFACIGAAIARAFSKLFERQPTVVIAGTPGEQRPRRRRKAPKAAEEEVRAEPEPFAEEALVPVPAVPAAPPPVQAVETPAEGPADEDEQDEKDLPPYEKPSFDLLDESEDENFGEVRELAEAASKKLVETLAKFDVAASMEGIICGPVVTCYELKPAEGVKVSRITTLENDIALAMKAKSIRIVAPIPGRDAVGIELPNEKRRLVIFSHLVHSKEFETAQKKMTLPLSLGMSLSGEVFVDDLADMPHLLVAGATGSGKSVCINTILMSLLYRFEPHELKLVLVDPKHVELVPYHNLPHLLTPVLNEPGKVPDALEWMIEEMERRYKYFARLGVRNIAAFNAKRLVDQRPLEIQVGARVHDVPLFLPFIILMIDELADLMLVAADEVEKKIIRLAQLARAAGIHMIVATQRPSANVITGLIKANIPARIAFRTTSNIDSRVIIDEPGSEKLLGKGDMLYKAPSVSRTMRLQGAYISEEEVKRVTDCVRVQRKPKYVDLGAVRHEGEGPELASDDKFDEAVAAVLESGQASASYLQRRMQVGYARAARLVDLMEAAGIIGPKRGAKPRDILVENWQPENGAPARQPAAEEEDVL